MYRRRERARRVSESEKAVRMAMRPVWLEGVERVSGGVRVGGMAACSLEVMVG